jgi:hypothetical protein
MEFFRQTVTRFDGIDENNKVKIRNIEFLNPRGQLKKKLLPQILGKKFPDFVRVRKVIIDSIVADDGTPVTDIPLTLRSREQLATYIRENKLPVDPNGYINIDDLRADVLAAEQDPEFFARQRVIRDKRREQEKEFMELNRLDADSEGTPTPVVVGGTVARPPAVARKTPAAKARTPKAARSTTAPAVDAGLSDTLL